MKKFMSLILALMMVISMAAPAFAAEETGTITVNGIGLNDAGKPEATYEIYQMLELASYDNAKGAYTYAVVSAWNEFFTTGGGKDYVTIDAAGNVTANANFTEATAQAFAALALAYADDKDIDPIKTTTNTADYTVNTDEHGVNSLVFSGLDLGYYLIDSTIGALCGLTTTKPNASITTKNLKPTIDKSVEEDSLAGTNTNAFGSTNTADIGQKVNFDVTISAQAGAQEYVYHDKMSEGLTFDPATLKISHTNPATEGGFTHDLEAGADKDYVLVTEGLTDGCTFEVRFTEKACEHISANDKIILTYSAILNEKAVVGAPGNPNEAWLEFGDEHTTTTDKTTTYTFGFDLVKTDASGNMLEGAEFQLYLTKEGGDPLQLAYNATTNTYRLATKAMANEELTNTIKVTKDANGNTIARVVGLDNGTYFLEETKVPTGYNAVVGRKEFTISSASNNGEGSLFASFTDGAWNAGSGVHVENKTGATMPETGGMGTVLFVTFGMFTVLATGVLLVTKKRMSMIED